MNDHPNCPKCNYPVTESGSFLGLYSPGVPCPYCNFLDKDQKIQLLITKSVSDIRVALNDLAINLKRDKIKNQQTVNMEDYKNKLTDLISDTISNIKNV